MNLHTISKCFANFFGYKKQFPGSAAYWEKRYEQGGNSGAGSYNRLAEFKAEILNDFCNRNNIQKIIEFGCGDGNQLKLAKYKNYIGLDVSEKSIEICKKIFQKDDTKEFYVLDNLNLKEKLFKADLVLSLDVIFHLVEDSVFETYMNNLFSTFPKYVIIYASNYEFQPKVAHVRHRCFTNYIEKQYPEFSLIDVVKNKYPFDEKDPNNTSFADFYFFEKKS
jgi:cyclopropane fatty-acyl-phospholipid synthase-like methyltransferase